MTAARPGRIGYQAIAETLRREITAGAYPNLQLPTQARLCERFGVSRMTIAHAISELEKANLVTSVQGKGIFLHNPDDLPRPFRPEALLQQDLDRPQASVAWGYFASGEDAQTLVRGLTLQTPLLNPLTFKVLINDTFNSINSVDLPGLRVETRYCELTMQPMLRLTSGTLVVSFEEDRRLCGANRVGLLNQDPHYQDHALNWFKDTWNTPVARPRVLNPPSGGAGPRRDATE